MRTKAATAYAPVLYGAYELKQGYRGAMLTGLILAVLGHLLIVGSVLLYQSLTLEPVGPEFLPGPNEFDRHVIAVNPPPPPSVTTTSRPVRGANRVLSSSGGLFRPLRGMYPTNTILRATSGGIP